MRLEPQCPVRRIGAAGVERLAITKRNHLDFTVPKGSLASASIEGGVCVGRIAEENWREPCGKG